MCVLICLLNFIINGVFSVDSQRKFSSSTKVKIKSELASFNKFLAYRE